MARVIRGGARIVRERANDATQHALGSGAQHELVRGLAELARERSRIREAATREIGTLALEVATRIVSERIEVEPGLLDRIVLRAIARARADTAVRVLLHPSDRALFAERLGDRLPPEITLVDDETRHRGGCLVRGTLVTIDARVETAVAAIAQAMGVDVPT